MTRGAIYKLLSNPIYIGQIRHQCTCYPGQHEAIIDQMLWEQVQQQLTAQGPGKDTHPRKTCPSLLIGKLFDASGNRLTPSHAVKQGRRYRYYISNSLMTGTKAQSPNSWRLPAQEIEQTVIKAAKTILDNRSALTTALQDAGIKSHQTTEMLDAAKNIQADDACLIERLVQRVELREDGISLTLSLAPLAPTDANTLSVTITHDIPMQMKRRGIEMRLVIDGCGPATMDQTLIKTTRRAHRWFQELLSGKVKRMSEIAAREGVDKSYINKRLSLAFFAPDIIKSIAAGQQPIDLNVEKLVTRIDLPLAWPEQQQLLGFH